MFSKVTNSIGRRGAVLCIIGGVWIMSSVGYLNDTVNRFSTREPSPLSFTDHNWWGYLWLACGLIGIAVGVQHRRKSDVIGFAAIVLPVLLWFLFYVYSYGWFLFSDGMYGQGNTWRGALAYGLIFVLIQIIAGWEDTTDPLIKFKRGVSDSK